MVKCWVFPFQTKKNIRVRMFNWVLGTGFKCFFFFFKRKILKYESSTGILELGSNIGFFILFKRKIY